MRTGETRIRWRMLLAGFVSSVLIAAIACGSDGEASSDPTGAKPLVVYSGRSESLVGPVIEQFKDLTGIQVQVNYGSTGALAATLLEEGSRTPADIFFAQDPGGLGAVIGMLDTLPPEVLNLAPGWARSPEGKWVGISGRARVLVYGTDALSESDLPESIWDLTDPKWKGKIGWAPSNSSFQAMVTGMRRLWGEDKTRDWLEGIVANDPITYPNNSTQVAAAAAGEIEIGMVNHYYLYQFLAEEGDGFRARNWFTPARDPGSVVLAAGAGVLSASDNKEAANRFLEFMLSPVAQQYFATQTHEYPLIEGVVADRGLPPLESIAKPDVDLSTLGDLENTQDLLRDVGALS
ncbi:MAG: iron ABC transporter substrate-binding protein [Chloroflexi bacterium]|nr:iron ABC transporter substrate-binding protein [Chloroflexota bacterium]MDA1297531.1 iron ABC transporter substrate-binding protein [Chloroflexota bacterium]